MAKKEQDWTLLLSKKDRNRFCILADITALILDDIKKLEKELAKLERKKQKNVSEMITLYDKVKDNINQDVSASQKLDM